MHEHDLDLIAALADGSLADETDARAMIESCEECLVEYQDQVEVLALLVATPTARMNDLERAALHRDLWAELRKSPTKTGSTPWWVRWSYVAAGLFVTVGLVSVLVGQGLVGGGQDAAVMETFSEIGSGLDGSGGGQVPLSGFDAEEDAEEDAASATTTAAAAEALPYPFAELADEARAKVAVDRSSQTQDQPDEGAAAEECLERLSLAEQVVVEELELDRRYLVVMPEEGTDDLTVTFIAAEDCEIVFVDG
jgi:hypothetical protein